MTRYRNRAGLALGAIVLGAAPQPALADAAPDPIDESGQTDVGIAPGEDDATVDVPPPAPGNDQPLPADGLPDVVPPDDPPTADGLAPAPGDEGKQAPATAPPATTPAPSPPAAAPRALRRSPKPAPHRDRIRQSRHAKPEPAPHGARPPLEATPIAPTHATGPRTPPPTGNPGAKSYRVHAGDTIWSIAAARLGPGVGAARIAREVDRIWSLNRDRIASGDADLIRVGELLRLE